jgi:hypothetical protein
LKSRLADFEWEHLDKIKLREFDEIGLAVVPNSKEQLQFYMDTGICYTGMVGDKVVMIGGVSVTWPGVGFVWLLTSDLVKEHKAFFHRTCLNIIEKGIVKYKLHRVDTAIMKDHEVSLKWANRLGFQQEGIMKKYDSEGNDYCLFARVI